MQEELALLVDRIVVSLLQDSKVGNFRNFHSRVKTKN